MCTWEVGADVFKPATWGAVVSICYFILLVLIYTRKYMNSQAAVGFPYVYLNATRWAGRCTVFRSLSLSLYFFFFTPGGWAEIYVKRTAAAWDTQRESKSSSLLLVSVSATNTSLRFSKITWMNPDLDLRKARQETCRHHQERCKKRLIITHSHFKRFLFSHYDSRHPPFLWHFSLPCFFTQLLTHVSLTDSLNVFTWMFTLY